MPDSEGSESIDVSNGKVGSGDNGHGVWGMSIPAIRPSIYQPAMKKK